MFCATGGIANQVFSLCQGDAGGPLVREVLCRVIVFCFINKYRYILGQTAKQLELRTMLTLTNF